MKGKISCTSLALLIYGGILPVAEAHTVGVDSAGLLAGLAHPFMGLDHLLAMIAVGVWAGRLGGRSVWLVPLAFLGVMAMGSGLGLLGLTLPAVEPVIASSVLIMGLMVAGSVRLAIPSTLGIVTLFALFHGVAHGLELPQAASPIFYGLGFIMATASLHALGIGCWRCSRHSVFIQRLMGFSLMVAGTLLLTP